MENPFSVAAVYSDRGSSQYANYDFKKSLEQNGIIQSMIRKEDCWDNACAKSFFKTLKAEEIFHRKYQTKGDAMMSMFEFIEVKHFYLGCLSPEEFERCKIKQVA